MKKYLIPAALVLFGAAFAGCNKEANDEEKKTLPDPEVTAVSEIPVIPFYGTEFELKFTSSRNWMVTSASVNGSYDYDFKYSPIAGEAGESAIKLTFPANRTQEELEVELEIALLDETSSTEGAFKYTFPTFKVPAPSVTDAAGNSYKAAYLGGNYWMTENLRTIPEGMTASENPADKSGFWYPYVLKDVTITTNDKGKEVSSATAEISKDEATIKAKGYLYSANVYLGGVTYGEDNYTTFEGVQGICPKGWHIPTKADFVALCGYAQSANSAGIEEETDADAPFYAEDYKGGKYDNAVKCGWNPVLSGINFNGAGYNTTVITRLNSTKEDLFEKQALTYWAGSTGYIKTQVWSMMTSFTSNGYPEGRLYTGFNNATNGVVVRCVMDKAAE